MPIIPFNSVGGFSVGENQTSFVDGNANVTANTVSATGNVYTNSVQGNSYNNPQFLQPMSSDGSWSYGSFGNTSDIWLQASIYSGGDANHGFRVIDNYGNGEVLISIDGTGNTNVQTLNATGNIFSGNIKLVSDVIAGGNVSAAGNVQVSNNMSANSFMSTSALYMNHNSITENTTLQSGYNSMSAGPMQIPNGITFTAEPGARWTVA